MPKITPVLWYDMQGEAAAKFYVSLLPDSRIDNIIRAPSDNPSGEEGYAMVVDFTLAGQKFSALNGGPHFKPNEAVSFQISTDSQEETDRLWDAIVGNGGQESMCSWCKDKWGFSWQITPKRLMELITDSDPDRARRASQAMLKMKKIDIAAIERAADGD